jgi:hypothetical protein
MISDKRIFIGLCLTVWFINTSMTGESTLPRIWLGLTASLISVPLWVLIGTFFSSVGIFLFRLARIDITKGLSLWQKADVGLALAVVLKPALGILI